MREPADLENVPSCDFCGHTGYRPEMALEKWRLVRCAQCDLVFTSPRYSEAFLEDFYKNRYFEQTPVYFASQLQGPSPDEIDLARALKKQIEEREHPASRFLEVGCGSGHLLEAFLQTGWQAVGIDLSLKAVQAGKCRGLDVRVAGMDDPNLGHFDLIGAFHILEHMPSPKAFFHSCSERLAPGGYLIFEVPDYGCRRAMQMGKHWPYLYPDTHLFQFTEKTIHQYLQQAHFRVVHSLKVHGRGPLEDCASSSVFSAPSKGLKETLFKLRHLFYWSKTGKRMIRHFFWHTLGQGQFIRVLAYRHPSMERPESARAESSSSRPDIRLLDHRG